MSEFNIEILRRLGALEKKVREQKPLPLNLACAYHLALPALRAFWPCGANHWDGEALNYVDDIADDYDLVNANDGDHGYTNVAPWVDLNGTTQLLSYVDDPQFGITGTEANVLAAVRGLSLGGWYYLDTVDANMQAAITKDNMVAQRSYSLWVDYVGGGATATPGFLVHAGAVATSGGAIATGAWYHLVGVYWPSTIIELYLNGQLVSSNAVGVPASLAVSTAQLNIGACDSVVVSRYLDGKVSMQFIACCAFSSTIIQTLYHQTRSLFGV